MGVHHGSFIGSQPQLRSALGPLMEACNTRLSMHRSLVRLRWRLRVARNLGRESVQARHSIKAAQEKLPVKDFQAPLVEYVEGHSEAEEDEDDDDGEEDVEDEGEEDGKVISQTSGQMSPMMSEPVR